MNAKYYTPDIEEFHIGFEYEVDVSCIYDSGNRWVQYDTDAAISFKYDKSLYKAIQDQLIRVKYLDKEDIESLGFEYESLFRDGGSCTYGKSGWTIWYYRDNTMRNTPNRIKIIKSHHGIIFEGDIKNKSELKTLLKQLGIQ